MGDEPWPGEVVRDVLGLVLGPDEEAEPLSGLVGLALRRNPRRAHLPVSRVLGKHIPVAPARLRATAQALGHRAAHCLDADSVAWGDPVVVGYAENATALAHLVADTLDADHVVSTTRRTAGGGRVLVAFDEEHSHAPRHVLLPDDPERWTPDRPLVLVDDELSTGRTVAVTLRLLHRLLPRHRYVIAALADLRGPDDDAIARAACELGVRVDVVALGRAALTAPPDVLERAARQLATGPDTTARPLGAVASASTPPTVHLPLGEVREGARHGLTRAQRAALEEAVPAAAAALADALPPHPGRVLVLGCEELHYLPVRLAEVLVARGMDVEVGATSRSPLVARDVPGYPVRSALAFAAHDEALGDGSERYAYGLGAPGAGRYDTVVVVVDAFGWTPALQRPDGLLPRLGTVTGRLVVAVAPCRAPRPVQVRHRSGGLVAARRGPEFGTFAHDEVGWLLSDLSGIPLEASPGEREDAMSTGRDHYSRTLPQERAPSPEYAELVAEALGRSGAATAAAVGVLTDRLLARCGPGAVLVSLARAGTPVAVLMRRWAARVRGVVLPHYAISVVRGRGLDRAALAALTSGHDPASLVFVDGWTGSGGILDEVRADTARYARETGTVLDPTVAVLADPAHGTSLFGTREDLLIPQALLNATVSGLVSRTVARDDLLAPGAFHGAKFYAEVADADRTATFLDAISSCFPAAGTELGPEPARECTADRRGPRFLAGFARGLEMQSGQRLRAGLGETTRALLRRDPDAIYVLPDAGRDLDPVRRLCHERGVPVRPLPRRLAGIASPYRCVGVLRPRSPR